jgi:hypothetical protein
VRSCFRSANCKAVRRRSRCESKSFSVLPQELPIRCWHANYRPAYPPSCSGADAIKRKGWPAFWRIDHARVAPGRFPPNKRPRLSRPRCTVLPKTRHIGAFVPWPEPRGSVPRACNASGKSITSLQFVAKVRDIVGLYLIPPEHALVLSVDEKSQIQALDRTQPILPPRPGLPERPTYIYNGTVPQPCSPHSTWPQARSSRNAKRGIGTRSSYVS